MNVVSNKLLRVVRAVKTPLQLLWASPVTVVCFLVYGLPCVALGWYTSLGIVGNAVVLVHNPDKMPGWLTNLWKKWTGQCCGNFIVLKAAPGSSDAANRTLAHELEHTRQIMVWGILQPVMYVLSSFAAAMAGEDRYRQNIFEVAARRKAGQKID